MAATGKQRQASKPYNLRSRVGIPIENQAEDDGTYVNEFLSENVGQVLSSAESSDSDDGTCFEFSSQPSAGQVLLNSCSSDTDTSSTDWNTVFQKSIAGSDCSDSQTEVKRFKPRSSERDTAFQLLVLVVLIYRIKLNGSNLGLLGVYLSLREHLICLIKLVSMKEFYPNLTQ